MFEASVHPVILLGKFHDLFLKKFIHATRIDRVTPRREIGKWLGDCHLVPLVIRKHIVHDGYNSRVPRSRETRNGRQRTGENAGGARRG